MGRNKQPVRPLSMIFFSIAGVAVGFIVGIYYNWVLGIIAGSLAILAGWEAARKPHG